MATCMGDLIKIVFIFLFTVLFCVAVVFVLFCFSVSFC